MYALFAKLLKMPEADLRAGMKTFKRFSKEFIKPHWYFIVIAMVFMAIFSASTAGRLAMLKPMVNGVFGLKDMATVYKVSLFLAGITVTMAISQYIYTTLLATASIKIIHKARINLFDGFLAQDMKFFNKNSPGSLISVMVNDINSMNTLASDIPINIGKDFFTFLALFSYMMYQEPYYALILLAVIFLVIIPMRTVNQKVKKYIGNSNLHNANLMVSFEQTLNNVKEIKSYNTQAFEKKKVHGTLRHLRKAAFRIKTISTILPASMEIGIGFLIAGLVFYGGYSVINSGKDAGNLVVFIASLIIIYQPIKRLSEIHIKVKMGFLAITRYYLYLDQKPTIVEAKNAKNIDFTVENSQIEFKNITFSYDKNPVFKNFNLQIPAKKKLALVGKSGGGKSTLVALISRFYDPQKGEITIGGHNIKDLSFNSLRNAVSFVGQDVVLFDDTIFNNIKYGSPNATEQQVIEAAKNAYCYDFIMATENQFQTQVGSRGIRLSGGQKQRVSIARALLKNAPILLLDEATSALDSESEQHIQKALEKLSQNKTSVVIAHRLSTIINSDVICVVENGDIVEQGTHNQLINKKGAYKYLYDLQFKDHDDNKL